MAVDRCSLAVTSGAAAAMRQIAITRGGSARSGLRISRTDFPVASLLLSVVEDPAPDDLLVRCHGARLFIERAVAASITGRLIDVDVNEQGVAFFSLSARGAADGDEHNLHRALAAGWWRSRPRRAKRSAGF